MLSPEDCTSLIEAFTEEQILGHVKSLDTGLHISQDRIQVNGQRDRAEYFVLRAGGWVVVRMTFCKEFITTSRKDQSATFSWSKWVLSSSLEGSTVITGSCFAPLLFCWYCINGAYSGVLS